MQFLIVVLASFLSYGTMLCGSQGIKGNVVWVSGNQMPGPGKKTALTGIKREILIYKPTALEQVTKNEAGDLYQKINTELVATAASKADGSFKIKLPPGEYSVFIKERQGLFANIFDEKGRINVVNVESGKYTQVTVSVDYMAAF